MKPITEDIGKTRVEPPDLPNFDQHLPVSFLAVEDGSMTARILPFRQGQGGAGELRDQTASVHDLRNARRERSAARTVSGMFVYSARL